MHEALLDQVTTAYLDSPDFNGIALADLQLRNSATNIVDALCELVERELLEILAPSHDVNTHIKRFGVHSKEQQVAALRQVEDPHHTCIYPAPAHLVATVDRAAFDGRPYALALALGEPQLAYRSFDLAILEVYRNDPRYEYHSGGVAGQICVSDAFHESSEMLQRDRVLLETFGFSVNDDLGRAVAVFLRYLARLSSDHQQLWRARELSGDYGLHPIYYKANILGEWYDEVPILLAFLMELSTINAMAEAMGRPKLFREVPGTTEELPGFDFLIRPTQVEFDAFVHLLDKLLSENLNKAFFESDISDEDAEQRPDGKVVVRPKGTLRMLDEWMRAKFRPSDWTLWERSMTTLRKIRKLRQGPAHAIVSNTFDRKFSVDQRQLIVEAYDAAKLIRLAFSTHPDVRKRNVEVDPALAKGNICDF